MEEAVALIRMFGYGALIPKADVKSSFRLLPVNPAGFNSLGIYFDGGFYFDKCLSMGFTLSCYYFEAFASFIQWVVEQAAPDGGVFHDPGQLSFCKPCGFRCM